MKILKTIILLVIFSGFRLISYADVISYEENRIIFVDNSLSATCEKYDLNTRTCGNGENLAYTDIETACLNALPGDIILIREGKYQGSNNRIVPLNSGMKGKEIYFKNYDGEKVVISSVGSEYAIFIEGKEYITIEGLTFSEVHAFGRIIDSNHIILRRNNFLNMNSNQWLALHFVNSNYNKFLDNTLYSVDMGSGKDNLQFVYSNHNLIEGNRIESIGHVLWAIKCGCFNVVRNNYFYNHNQKIGEVFDCNDGTTYTVRHTHVNATKFNLIDNNIFAYTDKDRKRERDGRPSGPYNGIQYAGQDGIIRRNVFYNNLGGGLGLTTYFDEAEYNTGNRVYNNLFYKNGHGTIDISGSTRYSFSDNILKNNILYKNYFTNWDNVYDILGYSRVDGKPLQILTSRKTADYLFENNNIFNTVKEENHLIASLGEYKTNDPDDRSLQYWEKNYPDIFKNNLQEDPLFVDAEKYDFRLRTESPMIDKGLFLTKTTKAGSGFELPLEDVRYFYDGYDIEGETGDLIQLEKGGRARIVSIDYEANILILDRELIWDKGQGISLSYSGFAPDMGPYEFISDPSGSGE